MWVESEFERYEIAKCYALDYAEHMYSTSESTSSSPSHSILLNNNETNSNKRRKVNSLKEERHDDSSDDSDATVYVFHSVETSKKFLHIIKTKTIFKFYCESFTRNFLKYSKNNKLYRDIPRKSLNVNKYMYKSDPDGLSLLERKNDEALVDLFRTVHLVHLKPSELQIVKVRIFQEFSFIGITGR